MILECRGLKICCKNRGLENELQISIFMQFAMACHRRIISAMMRLLLSWWDSCGFTLEFLEPFYFNYFVLEQPEMT